MKKFNLSVIVLIFLFSSIINFTYAQIDQNNIIKSGEIVVCIWTAHFKEGFDLLKKREGTTGDYYWDIRRLTLMGTPSYDIRKTDSLISPYKLIISFEVKYEDNTLGPNVNGVYSKTLKRTFGYKSAEDAIKYTDPEDFVILNPIVKPRPGGNILTFTVYYAFQNKKWLFKGGSGLFESNFYGSEETDSLKKLLSDVPVE